MVSNKLIFLNSQSPRSGHNFVAEVIRCIVDTKTAIGDKSEIPLAPVIEGYYNAKDNFYKSADASTYLDDLFLKDLRKKILPEQGNMMIKYTAFDGADRVKNIFPEDIHIISYRDPRDCLISIFKGLKLKSDTKSIIKKILMPFGIYHYTYAKKYSKKILSSFPRESGYHILKYEDLVIQNDESLEALRDLFQVGLSIEEIKKRMDGIKVINSSFYKEETSADKMWNASEKTEKFNPINRRKGFSHLQLLGITLGSKPLRKRMGYI